MDAFFEWLSGDTTATGAVIVLLVLGVATISLIYIAAFKQGRHISFWPPSIGPQSRTSIKLDVSPVSALGAFPQFEKPLLISSSAKNHQRIESDFLQWEECTIMLWVLVPAHGQGLRDLYANRYLLAHNTGHTGSETYYNQFSLRYGHYGEWNITFSDNGAKYTSSSLTIKDGLEPGWHHFLVAWKRSTPVLMFSIDASRGGVDRTDSFDHWPERLGASVSVGSWTNDWEGHYCETKLYRLSITDRFLQSDDPLVRKHISLKPRS